MRNMIAGFDVVSTWAPAIDVLVMLHWFSAPQYTRTKANWDDVDFGLVDLTAKYTEYSRISPWVLDGGSHDKWAPSPDFEIFMADGAPG